MNGAFMTAEDAARVLSVPSVLIVDDEADMREMLCDLIESAGLAAVAVEDGAAMRAELANGGYALLILDLRLNREDGLTLARSVRADSAIPIIILTGKGDETDRILGLELAADDYLMKPFNPRELIARVRALLRRAGSDFQPAPASPNVADQNIVRFGRWSLDLALRLLRDQDDRPCALTPSEYALLETLVRHPGRVLTRDQLLEHLRGQESDTFDRTIDVLVLRLRRKIERNPAYPEFILTERGLGYLFRPRPE